MTAPVPHATRRRAGATPLRGAVVHPWWLNLAYATSGGTLSGDALADLLGAATSAVPDAVPQAQALSQVARWIVSRRVVAFNGPAGWLLPHFQFDLAHCSVRAEVSAVLVELNTVFDADQTALWFVTPNDGLAGAQPVLALRRDRAAVLQAAQADRDAARGV